MIHGFRNKLQNYEYHFIGFSAFISSAFDSNLGSN